MPWNVRNQWILLKTMLCSETLTLIALEVNIVTIEYPAEPTHNDIFRHNIILDLTVYLLQRLWCQIKVQFHYLKCVLLCPIFIWRPLGVSLSPHLVFKAPLLKTITAAHIYTSSSSDTQAVNHINTMEGFLYWGYMDPWTQSFMFLEMFPLNSLSYCKWSYLPTCITETLVHYRYHYFQ